MVGQAHEEVGADESTVSCMNFLVALTDTLAKPYTPCSQVRSRGRRAPAVVVYCCGMDAEQHTTARATAVRSALVAKRAELLALVRRRGGARVDAEDVLHIALQRALERADQIHDVDKAEAWVARVVRNVLVDELRKKHVAVPSIDAFELALDEEVVDCWCVLAQAKQLKPEYATILRRVVVEGASVTAVAPELGLTPNNAMVRLHRARKALKARLESHCGTTNARSCLECGCAERGCCPIP